MTHTTTVVRSGNQGDHNYVLADVDITSLANANNEPFDPAAELGLDVVFGGAVLQLENPGTYIVQVAQNNDLYVESYGGTDPAAATDVGVVRVKFEGDPSA